MKLFEWIKAKFKRLFWPQKPVQYLFKNEPRILNDQWIVKSRQQENDEWVHNNVLGAGGVFVENITNPKNRTVKEKRRRKPFARTLKRGLENDRTKKTNCYHGWVNKFIDDRIVFIAGRTESRLIYEEYETWCRAKGMKKKSSISFFREFNHWCEGKRIYHTEIKGVKAYEGVWLRSCRFGDSFLR